MSAILAQSSQEFIENMSHHLKTERTQRAADYFNAARVLMDAADLDGVFALTNKARAEEHALKVAEEELEAASRARGISRDAIYDFGRYLDMHLRLGEFAPAARAVLNTLHSEVDTYMRATEEN